MGYQVPPGISDATVPNPIFNLTPAATVDEGNNWVNISWGPLAETNPLSGATLGNYAPTAGSPVVNYVTPANSGTSYAAAPALDFFGNARKTNSAVDAGAVEFGAVAAPAAAIGAALSAATVTLAQTRNCPGTTSAQMLACALDPVRVFTLRNTGTVPLTGITQGVLNGTPADLANYSVVRLLSTCGPAGGGQLAGQTTLAPGAACIVTVQFKPLTGQVTGLKPVGISVTDLAGTQASVLNGTAN